MKYFSNKALDERIKEIASGSGGDYTAGTGIEISDTDEISIDPDYLTEIANGNAAYGYFSGGILQATRDPFWEVGSLSNLVKLKSGYNYAGAKGLIFETTAEADVASSDAHLMLRDLGTSGTHNYALYTPYAIISGGDQIVGDGTPGGGGGGGGAFRLSELYDVKKNLSPSVDDILIYNSGIPLNPDGTSGSGWTNISKASFLSDYYTKGQVDNLIGAIDQFHYEIAASTSAVTNPQSNVLYLIGPTGSGSDKYEEYVYANNTWTKIGDTSIDLSNYVQSSAIKTLTLKVGTTTIGNAYDPLGGSNQTLTISAQNLYDAIGASKYHKYGGDEDLTTFKIGGATFTWHPETSSGAGDAYLELNSAFVTSGDQIVGSGTPGGGGSGGVQYLSELQDVSLTNLASGQILQWNGSAWVNVSGGGGGAGTVTSVALSVPTGLSVSGSPITSSGTLAVSFATGYSIPLTADVTKGVTAYGWGDHSQAGYLLATTAASTYQPLDADLTAIAELTGPSSGQAFLKRKSDNTWVLDTNTYLTSHQTIYTLTLQVAGTQVGTYTPNSAAATLNITNANITSAIGAGVYHAYGGDTSLTTFKIGGATFTWHAASGSTPGYMELDCAFLTSGDQIVGSGTPGGGGGGGAGYLYELGDTASSMSAKPSAFSMLVYDTNATDKQSNSGAWVYAGASAVKTSLNISHNDITDWATATAGFSGTDENVKQTATTTSAAYEVLFSYSANNTTSTEGTRKTSTFTYNPSTKALSTGGAINGLTLTAASTGFTISGGTTSKTLTVGANYTLGTACEKTYTDSSSASAISSSGVSLVTERDVYYGLPTINGAHNYTSSTTIYAPTSLGSNGQLLSTNGSAFTWVNPSDLITGGITITSITSETAIVESGIRGYSGSGNTWAGSITSMAYAAILSFGYPSRGWQIWARRDGTAGDGLRWRRGNSDATDWSSERLIYDSSNFVAGTNYVAPATTLAGYGITDWIVTSTGTALDSLTTAGVYRLGSQTSPYSSYGNLLVIRGSSTSDTLAQMYFPYNADRVYFRRGTTSNFTSNSWNYLWHSGNFNPGDYLPLAGGTMTGPIYIPNGNAAMTVVGGDSAILFGTADTISTFGQTAGTTYLRSGATNLQHTKNGTNYTIWDSSNSGTGYAWGCTTLTATSYIYTANNIGINGYDSATTARSIMYLNTNNHLIIGNGLKDVASGGYLYLRGVESHIQTCALGGTWTDRLIINSSGNVGIGTSSPSYKLHVSGTSSATITQMMSVENTSDYGWTCPASFLTPNLTATHAASLSLGVAASTKNLGAIQFYYAGSGSNSNLFGLGLYGVDWALTVSGGGNVGVGLGTTAASYKLHVNGSAYATSLTLAGALSGATSISATGSGTSGWVGTFAGTNAKVLLAANAGYGIYCYSTKNAAATKLLHLTYNDANLDGSGSVAMSVGSDGNVGIGTASPAASLDVRGPSATCMNIVGTSTSGETLINIYNYNQTTNGWRLGTWATSSASGFFIGTNIGGTISYPFYIRNGNVGIGTSSPSTKLEVTGVTKILEATNLRFYTSVSGGTIMVCNDSSKYASGGWTGGISVGTDGTAAGGIAGVYMSGSTINRYWYGGTSYSNPLMVILPGGNVGIGTTTPSYKLHVTDSIGTDGSFAIVSSAGDSSHGIALYAGTTYMSYYGIYFAKTSDTYGGTHGGVSGDYATYFTMYGSNRGWIFRHRTNGCVASISSTGTFTTNGDQVISSDATLKENLQPVTYSISDIAKARAVTFDWKDGRGHSAGSIAQDWKALIPELVHGEEGNMTLAYGQIALLNTILLARKSESHEERIKELEARVAELELENEQLRMN